MKSINVSLLFIVCALIAQDSLAKQSAAQKAQPATKNAVQQTISALRWCINNFGVYAGTILYFTHVVPYLESKATYKTKGLVFDQPLADAYKKIFECFLSVLCLDKIKDHAKVFGTAMGYTADSVEECLA